MNIYNTNIKLKKYLSEITAAKFKFQFHATSRDRAEKILKEGFKLARDSKDIRTHNYKIKTISLADEFQYAEPYGDTVIKVKIIKGAKFLKRSFPSSVRQGENLENAVNRWLKTAKDKDFDGVLVGKGIQSTVGNQILNPKILIPVSIIERDVKNEYL